jgi:hypothetical protein
MTGAVRATPKARLASARTVPPPGLAALGLSWNGLKHNRAFDVLVGNNAVRTALFAIFSPGQWLQATDPLNGPQMPDGGRSPSCRPKSRGPCRDLGKAVYRTALKPAPELRRCA